MRLGVHGWLVHGARTGARRYFVNLLTRWGSDAFSGKFDAVTLYSPRPLDQTDVVLPDGLTERVVRPPAGMLVWENLRLGPTADDDVLFCPSYSRPLIARAPTVVAIHDATSKMHPKLYGPAQPLYNRLYSWSAVHATLVVTSTHAARTDIARWWGTSPSAIRVVPLAADPHFHPLPDEAEAGPVVERVLGSSDPYFLFVGKTTGRRRVPMLLESFATFRRETGLPHKLVLAGPRPTFEFDEAVARLGLVGSVKHSDFVSDGDLNALYNAAQAVVCPSVYETVSLPIMEAQATGTPVLCVDSPGSREITGGSALFMPQLDLRSLVDAMTRIAANESLRGELREGGLANARQYSWQRTALETLDVLAEAATRSRGALRR